MPELRSPFDGAVIDVHMDNVDRFVEAGWEATKKAPAKKAASSKSDDSK